MKTLGLTRFEATLWAVSATVIVAAFGLSGWQNIGTMVTSLIGVTAVLFIAKGYVIGQVLVAVFSLLYGVISLFQQYYGEVITYLGMTTPSAIVTAVVWLKHPFRESREVTVAPLTKGKIAVVAIVTTAATVVFYVVLKALGNADLLVSTASVATSMAASCLTAFRSPYYAIGYASNDVVLIVLWTLAAVRDPSLLPMVACFAVFLVNDLYGFVQWKRMQHRQED
ncbi:MAG: nicotinamide mononucleotide transporter [Clostridia bacterium]|nr:nicotinamide mononucleotide transporter [Clostridia bacterium]